MAAIFSIDRLNAIKKAFFTDNLSRAQMALKFNMDAENIDRYLLKVLKEETVPALKYGLYDKKKRGATQALLLPPDSDVVVKKQAFKLDSKPAKEKEVIKRPAATYSNGSGYGRKDFKSLLDQVK